MESHQQGLVQSRKKDNTLWWVLASLLAHVLLLLVISLSTKSPAEFNKTQPNQPKPIQARLVFLPPEPTVSEPETATQAQVQPAEMEVSEKIADVSQAAEPPQQTESQQTPEPAEVPTEIPVPPKIDTGDALQRYFRHQQYQQQQDLAEQASREYQQNRLSPDLSPRFEKPVLSEDEKLRKKIVKNVDCSNGSNKALALLSGLGGGTVQCTRLPDVQQYIQRRLDKEK